MRSSLLVVLSLAISGFAVGCGGETADIADEPSDSAEDALTASELPNVTAISFETTRRAAGPASVPVTTKGPTVALKTKVAKAMRAVKVRRPGDPIPACGFFGTRTTMHFLNAKGDEIASGSYSCSIGSVVVKGGREISIFVQSTNITNVMEMPLVPADVLYGIDQLEVTRRGAHAANIKTKDAAAIDEVLAGMDLDHPPVKQEVVAHCLPSHTVAFNRKGKTVASASYICGSHGPLPATLKASFSAFVVGDEDADPIMAGTVALDPRIVERLLP